MKFYIYHPFSMGLVYLLTHNTQNRIIDKDNELVICEYNNHKLEFNFNNFRETEKDSYHIIFRQDSVKYPFMYNDMNHYQIQLGFPECAKHEYKLLLDNLDFNLNWILFWNYGENKFVHIRKETMARSREIKYLKQLSEKTKLFSDNIFTNDSPLNEILDDSNFNSCLTNDVYVWNYLAHIRWASEFKNIYENLNPPHKLCVSFRSPKHHRIEIIEKLGNQNNDNIFLSFSSAIFEEYRGTYDHSWTDIHYDTLLDKIKSIPNVHLNDVGFDVTNDFENLYIVGNTEKNQMEFDYYFRILPKAKVQLLDETHAYISDIEHPMNLSEKTYIFLLSNIPFISTHHYPFDLIKKHIVDLDYPYYDEMVKVSNNTDELVNFINYFLDNFDEMYPKIKEWTNKVHIALMKRMDSENSFLEHMTTKINQ